MKATSRPDAFDNIRTGTGSRDPKGLWSVWRSGMSQPLKRRHAVLLSALLVASLPADLRASDTAQKRGCGVVREAVSGLSACVATPNGVELANAEQEAATLAGYSAAGVVGRLIQCSN